MSTFAEVRAALLTVVKRISGHAHVQWRDQRQEFPADGVTVKLHARSLQNVGTPEQREREDLDDPGAEVKFDVVSQKRFTLQVLVEHFDQYETANQLAQKIGTRFFRPYTLDALATVDCAIQNVEAPVDITIKRDGRIWSAVSFDVRLAWVTVDTQEDFDAELEAGEETDATTFIETVTFAGPAEKYGESTVDTSVPL